MKISVIEILLNFKLTIRIKIEFQSNLNTGNQSIVILKIRFQNFHINLIQTEIVAFVNTRNS